MSHNPGPLYNKLKKVNKYKNKFDVNLLPEIKTDILKILLDNKNYWDSKDKTDQGISKNNLITKLNKKIPAHIFEFVLEELIVEQKILFYEIDNVVRYFYFEISK
jgi:hypothetical protein